MAITGTPERSYYDGDEQRSFWTVEAIVRWSEDCYKRRERYMGKFVKIWNGTFKVIDVVFTEPGLIGWVLYQDGDEIRKMREDQMFSKIVK